VDVCCDISARLPVPAARVAGIFTEHCLEHLSLEQGRAFLADCHRVMRPGAFLRIVIPDLEMYARAYVAALDGSDVVQPNEYYVNNTGINLPVALINELFYGPTHRFMYDFATLAEVLRDSGFREITKCAIGAGSDPRLLIDDPGHRSESMYVDARKS